MDRTDDQMNGMRLGCNNVKNPLKVSVTGERLTNIVVVKNNDVVLS